MQTNDIIKKINYKSSNAVKKNCNYSIGATGTITARPREIRKKYSLFRIFFNLIKLISVYFYSDNTQFIFKIRQN